MTTKTHLPRAARARLVSLSWFAFPAIGFAQADPAPPVLAPPDPGPPTLLGGGLALTIDEVDARFVVATDDGVQLVSLPIGAAASPGRPRRIFRWDRSPEDLSLLANEPEKLAAAIFNLRAGDGEAEVALGARAAEGGILLSFGLPGAALSGLPPSSSVLPLEGDVAPGALARPLVRVGGSAIESSLVLTAPAAIELRGDLLEPGSDVYRLVGIVAAPDDSTGGVGLRIESGGDTLFDSGDLPPGQSSTFDLALRAADRVRLATNGRGRLVLAETELRFAATDLALLDLVLDAGPAVELFTSLDRRIELAEGAVVLDAVDGTERGGEDAVDARRRSMFVPPFLLMIRAQDRYLGIGLATLTDASAMTFVSGRLSLALPTRRLGAISVPFDPDDPEGGSPRGTILTLALIGGRSRQEVLERYRYALVADSSAAALRMTAAAANPTWWRRPILRLAPNPPIPFDALDVKTTVDRAAEALGFSDFTVLVDGPWNSRPGDLDPADGFATLRSLIAQSHVDDRQLLLSIDAFSAAPGSFADLLGLASDSVLDTTAVRKHERYAKEIARRIVSRESNGFGADGIVLRNVSMLRDPASDSPVADATAGLGLHELKRHVEQLKLGLLAHREDAILLAPIALPQLVEWIDGHVLETGAGGDLAGAIETAKSVLPDQPLFVELDAVGEPRVFLQSLARSVVYGTPIVDAAALLSLAPSDAALAGALLSLAAERPLGVAGRDPDGRPRMMLDGRVLAEMLPGERAIAVHPARDRMSLVLLEEGPIELPFSPSSAPDGVEIGFAGKGATMNGGKAGVVYRFTR